MATYIRCAQCGNDLEEPHERQSGACELCQNEGFLGPGAAAPEPEPERGPGPRTPKPTGDDLLSIARSFRELHKTGTYAVPDLASMAKRQTGMSLHELLKLAESPVPPEPEPAPAPAPTRKPKPKPRPAPPPPEPPVVDEGEDGACPLCGIVGGNDDCINCYDDVPDYDDEYEVFVDEWKKAKPEWPTGSRRADLCDLEPGSTAWLTARAKKISKEWQTAQWQKARDAAREETLVEQEAQILARIEARDDPPRPLTDEEWAELQAIPYEPRELTEEEQARFAEAIDGLLAQVEAEADANLSKKERKLRALNEQFAVVTVGSDVLILWEQKGKQPIFLNESAFRRLLANEGKAGRAKIATAWIDWPGRREYRGGVVFKPGGGERADEYNLWRGWGVTPSREGSCDLFLQHIREVVCGGNEFDAGWALDWFAHIFQRPQEKPESALALQGVQGAGKSIVGDVLKRLLGDSHIAVSESAQITGRFNGHLADKLVLQGEEAFWYKDHGAERVLKHLVTGKHLAIERKGVDVVNMPNYTRLLLTTNADAVWPTSIDERRLAIFRVSSEHAKDREYFGAMIAELEAGGYERLLDLFLTREIDRERLFSPPRTEALEEQAVHSMTPEENWYLELLESGELPFSEKTETLEGGGALVPQSILYDSYVESLSRRDRALSERAFGHFLQKLPGEQFETSNGVLRVRAFSDRRARVVMSKLYALPPLPHCRKLYSERGRAAIQTWDEPDQQWRVASEHPEFEAKGGEA